METVDYRHRCGHSQAYIRGSREYLAGQGELCPKCKETFPAESISETPRNPFMSTIEPTQAVPVENTPTKLPIGLKPRKFWLEDRAKDLCGAIKRYLDTGLVPKGEWTAELDVICSELEAAAEPKGDGQ